MKRQAYRITSRKYADTAFDGEGARLHGGRWNPPGTPAVYLASTRSLAILELLVHIEDYSTIETHFVYLPVTFDEAQVDVLDTKTLAPDWDAPIIGPQTQQIGERWLKKQSKPLLRVPSVVVRGETNYLLNPQHGETRKLKIGPPEALTIDPRL